MSQDPEEAYKLQNLLDACFLLVSYRPRSVREIRDYAKRKKYPDGVISRALERLKDLGYLDDAAFTLWWVKSRSGRKAKGDIAITRELMGKGIPRDLITETIRQFRNDTGTDEKEAARRMLELKVRKAGKTDRRKLWAYLHAYLIRKGFTQETVRDLIDEIRRKDYNTPQDGGISEDI